MRKLFLLPAAMFAILALTACGGSESNLDKANGTWVCDAAATLAADSSLKDQPKEVLEMAQAMFSEFKMTIDSKAKKVSIAMGGNTESSDFKVASDADNKLVLEVDNEKATMEFKDNDTIVMSSEKDSARIFFKRAK